MRDLTKSLTKVSREPKVAKNAIDLVSRVNPKFHFPKDLRHIEKALRICLGLPIIGKQGGQVPYAYTWDEESQTYKSNKDIFALLWQARRYLYTSSIREVTDWLNLKARKFNYNVSISHMGLRNLMVMRPPYEECLLPEEEREKILESLISWNKFQKSE